MDRHSEDFLHLCGERFNLIADYTQVYDSVLSRSQNMRSASTLMKSMTAFMAEPTLNANLLYDAWSHATDKDYQGKVNPVRATAVFIAGGLLTALASALVTARRRDDDKEKPWLDTYLAAVASNFYSNINPLGLLPFLRDVQSMTEGWSVERADMSLFSDVVEAAGKLGRDNVSLYRKIEDFGGAIASFFGIPLKNVMRDIRALGLNTIGSGFIGNAEDTQRVLALALTGQEDTAAASYARMYDALGKGDSKAYQSEYDHAFGYLGVKEDSIVKGIKGLLKTDWLNGGVSEKDATAMLVGYLGVKDNVDAYYQLDEWTRTAAAKAAGNEDYNYSKYEALDAAVLKGSGVESAAKELQAHGMTEKEVLSAVKTSVRTAYVAGSMGKSTAESRLRAYAGMVDANELFWQFKAWDYAKANGTSDGYSDYAAFKAAIPTGTGLLAAARELLAHGKDKETIARIISTEYKEQYIALMNAGKKVQAASLLARVLTASEVLGYDRDKQLNYIHKNWK